jgi:hypothetical protein
MALVKKKPPAQPEPAVSEATHLSIGPKLRVALEALEAALEEAWPRHWNALAPAPAAELANIKGAIGLLKLAITKLDQRWVQTPTRSKSNPYRGEK